MQSTSGELTRDQIEALGQELKPSERILQIIHLNLLLGASVIVAIFYFQSPRIGGNDAPVPWLFLIVAMLPVVPSFIVPALMRASKTGSVEYATGQLAGIYQVSHIVGCAMLESGIIFSALAFTAAAVVPQWFILVPGILLLVLLLRFPLPGQLANWVVTQLESRRI
jgi:hypothetical protein